MCYGSVPNHASQTHIYYMSPKTNVNKLQLSSEILPKFQAAIKETNRFNYKKRLNV
jgi:hypothetical protein